MAAMRISYPVSAHNCKQCHSKYAANAVHILDLYCKQVSKIESVNMSNMHLNLSISSTDNNNNNYRNVFFDCACDKNLLRTSSLSSELSSMASHFLNTISHLMNTSSSNSTGSFRLISTRKYLQFFSHIFC